MLTKSMSAPAARLSEEDLGALQVWGATIRQARVAQALTRDALVQRILIGRRTLERIEAGAPEVAIGFYMAVAGAVGLTFLAQAPPTVLLGRASVSKARARRRPANKDWFK